MSIGPTYKIISFFNYKINFRIISKINYTISKDNSGDNFF